VTVGREEQQPNLRSKGSEGKNRTNLFTFLSLAGLPEHRRTLSSHRGVTFAVAIGIDLLRLPSRCGLLTIEPHQAYYLAQSPTLTPAQRLYVRDHPLPAIKLEK